MFSRVGSVWITALLCGACGSTSRDGAELLSMSGGSSGSGGTASSGGAPNSGGSSTAGSPSAGGTSNAGGAPSSGGTTGGSGGSGIGGGSSEGPGTITDPWRGFCVATFTEDYQVVDPFGAPLFMARTGEEYLIIRYPEPYTSASLAYLTSTGPYEFDVEPNADNTAFPFTTDCPTEFNAGSYFAVFADVSVYAEPELVTKICDLAAGTAVPRDETNAGFALEDVGGTGPSIYEIFLNAFSAQCGGAMTGYISVPRIQLFGSAHVVVPFRVITGPN